MVYIPQSISLSLKPLLEEEQERPLEFPKREQKWIGSICLSLGENSHTMNVCYKVYAKRIVSRTGQETGNPLQSTQSKGEAGVTDENLNC